MAPTIREVINIRLNGRLESGRHAPNGAACALEAASIARGIPWTDEPEKVGLPDLRPLNDAQWLSDEDRAKHLLPVLEGLWDWRTWTMERQIVWAKRITLRTIREILPPILHAISLHHEADACARADTLIGAICATTDAARKARAANDTARDVVHHAIRCAIRAASEASEDSAASAANDAALVASAASAASEASENSENSEVSLACRIWSEEALRTEPLPPAQ